MQRIKTGKNFASYRLGSLIVTALRDGYVDMPMSRLRRLGDQPFGHDFPDQIPLHAGKLRLSVNAFLIESDHDAALVDTGASDAWLPTMGYLPDALEEAGVDPGRITKIAFTHTHADHIHGLILPDGRDAFPNLKHLWVPLAELPLFRAEARLERFHDKTTSFIPGDTLGNLLEVIAAPGHEVGHSCFRVADGKQELLIWGDTIHVPAIQFERPELTWEFDTDQNAARLSRLQLLERSARPDTWVAGAHLDWPGVGKVVREQSNFSYCAI